MCVCACVWIKLSIFVCSRFSVPSFHSELFSRAFLRAFLPDLPLLAPFSTALAASGLRYQRRHEHPLQIVTVSDRQDPLNRQL